VALVRVLFSLTTCSSCVVPAKAVQVAVIVADGDCVPSAPPVTFLANATPFVSEKLGPATADALVAEQNLPKLSPFPSAPAVESAICGCLLSAKYAYQLPSVACAILSFLPLTVTVGSP